MARKMQDSESEKKYDILSEAIRNVKSIFGVVKSYIAVEWIAKATAISPYINSLHLVETINNNLSGERCQIYILLFWAMATNGQTL